MMKVDESFHISPSTPISELIELYPEVVDFLIEEYDFYCLQCFMAEWETLEEGARNHGIVGKDFQEMLSSINLQLEQ
ncbi:DUF1858 domain-containing protein [Candidatus Dojkabacteria bacterium]|uniref:DUF1858 domain-containing protein n=1 Tax=Candidatus Dojkabacteria bacterium TaxID=2099670 RepID=A0A955L9I1_9BACT|nr:DUF1858 domain-containing protein [Candidatus Dojkabacteria bacterium]